MAFIEREDPDADQPSEPLRRPARRPIFSLRRRGVSRVPRRVVVHGRNGRKQASSRQAQIRTWRGGREATCASSPFHEAIRDRTMEARAKHEGTCASTSCRGECSVLETLASA